MRKKDHGTSTDSDQWITNSTVFKQIMDLYGISRKEMNDATPFNRLWD
jgi:hypothetical protein